MYKQRNIKHTNDPQYTRTYLCLCYTVLLIRKDID